jgi:ditrans,polycis-polyprenyl diphosphate synthase
MEIVLRLERITTKNTKGVLNICFPYTSRDDITQAMIRVAKRVESKKLLIDEIDQEVLESEMYVGGHNPRLGMIVRTSGVTRFSDFMMWQSCEEAQVEFIDTLWPAFNKWEMIKLLLKWGFYETKRLKEEEIMQTKRHVLEKRRPPVVSVTEVDRAGAAAV